MLHVMSYCHLRLGHFRKLIDTHVLVFWQPPRERDRTKLSVEVEQPASINGFRFKSLIDLIVISDSARVVIYTVCCTIH